MRALAFVFIICTIIGISWFVDFNEVKHVVHDAIEYAHHLGPGGYVVFVSLHALAVSVCFPGTLLFELGAGVIFGLVHGVLVVSFSKAVGGSVGFLFGRYLLHDWVKQRIAQNPRYSFIYDEIGNDSFRFALLLRLSPIPSWINNYGLALTNISFAHFFLATVTGSLPFIVNNVYLGSSLGSLAEMLTDESSSESDEQQTFKMYRKLLFLVVSVSAVSLISFQLTKTVQKANAKHKLHLSGQQKKKKDE